jgi:hypothetical protein
MDTQTGLYEIQSPLKSHPQSKQINNHCGIHSISINPSRTLLATGSENVNDLSIYKLPNLEPLAVGFNAHNYWIFDSIWLNDDLVVSAGGDNNLAIWNVADSVDKSNHKTNFISKRTSLLSQYPTGSDMIAAPSDLSTNLKRSFNNVPTSSLFYSLSNRSSRHLPNFQPHLPFSTSNPFQPLLTNMSHSLNNSFDEFSSYLNLANNTEQNQLIMYNNNNSNHYNYSSQQDNLENEIETSVIEEEGNNEEDDFNDDVANTQYNYFNLSVNSGAYTHELGENQPSQLVNIDEQSDNFDSLYSETDTGSDNDNDDPFNSKRRKLDSFGNFKFQNDKYKFILPKKVTTCKQSKRIRALAFNPKVCFII